MSWFLSNFAYYAHIEIYNRDFNEQLSLADCHGREVWQCVPEERQDSVRKHAARIGFFRDLRPIDDSQEVLRELVKKYAARAGVSRSERL